MDKRTHNVGSRTQGQLDTELSELRRTWAEVLASGSRSIVSAGPAPRI